VLRWSTAAEANVHRFKVEKSTNGKKFEVFGVVKAGARIYSLGDEALFTTINYYRLKMIDTDGNYKYSPVRTVTNNTGFYIDLYPNPENAILQMQITSDRTTSLEWQVAGIDGKVVIKSNMSITEGSLPYFINVSALPPGSYFLHVKSLRKEHVVVQFEKM
jgi:hypothetical protein